MKISMEWLRQYCDIPVSDAEYESRMVMAGDGVEGMDRLGEGISGVVVGRVLTCEAHPDSDHLHVCTVDVGEGDPLQIVCGAPNVEAGILVPVALCGAKLPGGIEIKRSRLRGVESSGMLCSSEELGIPVELYPSVGSAGLMILHEDYPLGTDIRDVVGLNVTVADFEILANRPDCLSVWGMARETAAVLETPLRLPEAAQPEGTGENMTGEVKVTVEDEEGCPRYMARVVRNVKVGPSPLWIRQLLHASGMRSINNIVDITNLVMLETGHPMHAFDLDRVQGREIIVRRAREGEKLTTLDGKQYDMTGQELMICDAQGPTGFAGIMGGLESEITGETRTVLFECASFDRTVIRLTARRFGIRTESSGRFERGVSPRTVYQGMARACQLVDLLDAGDVAPGMVDLYPHPEEDAVVEAPVRYIVDRTGVELSGEEMKSLLERLYFGVTLQNGVLRVTVPEFRQDVEGKADIAEEVLRLAGYDRIPSTALRGSGTPGGLNEKMSRHQWVQDVLIGMGFYECMNYSFVSRKNLEQLLLPEGDERLQPVVLRNPLGEDTACLRTTLLCGVLRTAGTNQRGGNASGRVFEIGVRYDGLNKTAEGLPTERDTLCMALWGPGEDFFSVRTAAQAMLERLGVCYSIEKSDHPAFHPGRRCCLKDAEGRILCELGQAHPDAAGNYQADPTTFLCEMDLDRMFAEASPMGHVKVFSRFPAVERDLALVMDDKAPLGPLMDAMKAACGESLEEIRLFDVFRGIQVGSGRKSAAFKLSFRSMEHTLTEEEITGLVNAALKAAGECGAVLRL